MKENRIFTALCGAVALAFGVHALGLPVLEVSAYGMSETLTFADLGGWSFIAMLVRALNIAAIVCLLLPVFRVVSKRKFYYAGVCGVCVLEMAGALAFVSMKDKAIESSGVKMVMELLSVECNVTDTVWQFVVAMIFALICAGILFMGDNAVADEN